MHIKRCVFKYLKIYALPNEVDVVSMVVVDNPSLRQCIIIIVSTIYIFPLESVRYS